jgi:hypothetical protein
MAGTLIWGDTRKRELDSWHEMRAGVRTIDRELGMAQVTARHEARVTIINQSACDRSTRRTTVGDYPVTSCTLMQLGAARSGVTCLGLDNQPEGVRSKTRRITVGGYPVNIYTLMQLGAARSGVTGLGLDNQPKVALGELS